jgi:hypothetical protein
VNIAELAIVIPITTVIASMDHGHSVDVHESERRPSIATSLDHECASADVHNPNRG